LVTLEGKGRTRTDMNWRPCWLSIKVFGWRLCERFNVLKRFVVTETEEIEENAVERVVLATGVCSHACPRPRETCFEMPLKIG
jgi:hypothetical protein